MAKELRRRTNSIPIPIIAAPTFGRMSPYDAMAPETRTMGTLKKIGEEDVLIMIIITLLEQKLTPQGGITDSNPLDQQILEQIAARERLEKHFIFD